MSVPKPTQLNNGRWRVQITINGERMSKMFGSKKEAQMWAMVMKGEDDGIIPSSITIEEAVEKHLVLHGLYMSPTTKCGYRKILRNQFKDIKKQRIDKITNDQIQLWVNGMATNGYSLKTIKNAHGLLMTLMKENRPRFVSKTIFPKAKDKDTIIPTEEQIGAILFHSEGTKYELPIALALFCGLRASEIRGLTWDGYDGCHLTIDKAIVYADGQDYEKEPKTKAGNRTILLHPYVSNLLDRQEKNGTHIVEMTGQAMYKGFVRICENAKLPHFKFHSLRHYQASAMIVSGMPDKYAIGRMGHSTTSILQNVYQHQIDEEREKYEIQLNEYFNRFVKNG